MAAFCIFHCLSICLLLLGNDQPSFLLLLRSLVQIRLCDDLQLDPADPLGLHLGLLHSGLGSVVVVLLLSDLQDVKVQVHVQPLGHLLLVRLAEGDPVEGVRVPETHFHVYGDGRHLQ